MSVKYIFNDKAQHPDQARSGDSPEWFTVSKWGLLSTRDPRPALGGRELPLLQRHTSGFVQKKLPGRETSVVRKSCFKCEKVYGLRVDRRRFSGPHRALGRASEKWTDELRRSDQVRSGASPEEQAGLAWVIENPRKTSFYSQTACKPRLVCK